MHVVALTLFFVDLLDDTLNNFLYFFLLFSANDSSLRGRIGAAKKYRYRVTKRKLTSAWQNNEVGSLNFDIDTVVKIQYSVKVPNNGSVFCVR